MIKELNNSKSDLEKVEKDKYEFIDGEKKYKDSIYNIFTHIEYSQKSYSTEEKENLIDLMKFYSDWLYGPVDEEIENKLYFIDINDSTNLGIKVEDFLSPELKKLFKNTENNTNCYFGIRLKV